MLQTIFISLQLLNPPPESILYLYLNWLVLVDNYSHYFVRRRCVFFGVVSEDDQTTSTSTSLPDCSVWFQLPLCFKVFEKLHLKGKSTRKIRAN